METHKNRVAVVTGGSKGIGFGVAKALAARGADVVIISRSDGSKAAAKISPKALAISADASQEADWERVARTVDEHFGRADILVNNAGIYFATPIEDRKSTRLNSSHTDISRMPSSA